MSLCLSKEDKSASSSAVTYARKAGEGLETPFGCAPCGENRYTVYHAAAGVDTLDKNTGEKECGKDVVLHHITRQRVESGPSGISSFLKCIKFSYDKSVNTDTGENIE